ncbi:right-handed parallel beta-helix repeat-containing protein [Chitinophaga vietnamensis]|uniref:right-handed parallel beta-helix repeat-containing protein n=1 Tax=Chitinophaga vietnamensis TaxID=2593957 RepID=UPI001178A477|nr:right-handed parallel beta-helix repeat-containing protein [Chitinophaga vietnamensis]
MTTQILKLITLAILAAACSKGGQPTPDNNSKKAHTYYVSPQGNDNNSGAPELPLKTMKAALNKAMAGDTVVARGGIYYEQLVFPHSGTSDAWITVKAYPGEKPVIDGSYITVDGWKSLVAISNTRYLSLEGFDICNLISNAFNTDPEGIAINGDSHHINIKNCNIYNIKNGATLQNWRSAHAILVIGNGSSAITNLLITGCTVHDTWTGTSENITIGGNVDGFTISHNKIYHTENIGIIIADGGGLNKGGAPATNFARNGVVSDNELYNVSMSNSVDVWGANNYGAIAIYVCGGTNTVVERNIVHDCDRGIGMVSENDLFPTKTTIVRNNFVYNCWRTGIYMGGYLNFTSGGTYDCQVVNNTLFQNDKASGAFGEIEGEIRLTENCFNNVIRNNIVYARPVDIFIHKYTNTGSGNVIDNNLYFTTGTPQWLWNSTNGAPIASFDSWKTTSGADAASTYGADPLLVSTSQPDLHIQPSSPAKNSGLVISDAVNGTTDIDGNPRVQSGKISEGAQQ